MTLFDCSKRGGVISSVGGDRSTRRYLADLGLIGASVSVRVAKKHAVLADFSCGFSAVVDRAAALRIEVQPNNESSALRQPQRRKDHPV